MGNDEVGDVYPCCGNIYAEFSGEESDLNAGVGLNVDLVNSATSLPIATTLCISLLMCCENRIPQTVRGDV